MNDKHIDDLFSQDIPPADENARKIAINSALSEFSQGFDETARPIGNRDNWFSKIQNAFRSFFMTTQSKPAVSNTFATVAVVFVAMSVFILLPTSEQTSDLTAIDPKQARVESKIERLETPDAKVDFNAAAIVGADKDSDSIAKIEKAESRDDASIAVTQAQENRARQTAELERKKEAPAPSIEVAKSIVSSAEEPEQLASSIAPQQLEEVIMSAPQALKSKRSPKAKGLTMSDAAAPAVASAGQRNRLTRIEPNVVIPERPDLNEEYAKYKSNVIKFVADQPISTFSADVDTASYSLVRNQLKQGYLPSPQAVRAEELINYFNYDYALPKTKRQPFAPSISVFDSPWNIDKKLLHIGIKGYDLPAAEQPDSNIVFLLDVSGSMGSPNKLPLVKQSIGLLLDTLKPTDTISIAVYAGAAGTILEPTEVSKKTEILGALQRLNAGGSTAGGAGIQLAYQLAEQNFNANAVNRIVLATDGDFNVGMQSNEALKTLVERKRDKGIFLSVLGFGRNNYQDDMMQALAQNGNGVAAYIDTLSEAKKVLVDEATSTLFTIAKDVKFQVEFNPALVSDYRLIGYETRALKNQDFNNDKVDAGDVGAGHTVTVIYEITPANAKTKTVDQARYKENRKAEMKTSNSSEYGFLKIRYKLPNGKKSKLIEKPISATAKPASSEALFSTAVAGFAQLISNSKYTGDLSYEDVITMALKNKGTDEFGYRSEFVQLVRMAEIAKP